MGDFEHPPIDTSAPLGSSVMSSGAIGPRTWQNIRRKNPALVSSEDITYSQPESIGAHGLTEYRASPLDSLDSEEHRELKELEEMQELRTQESMAYKRLSPAAQLAAQARADFLDRPSRDGDVRESPTRARGSSAPVKPLSMQVDVLSPQPRLHAGNLGSPFAPKTDELPVAGAEIHPTPTSHPMMRQVAHPPHTVPSRKASTANSGLTKDELIDLLAKALRQEQKKVREQEMRKTLYKKEYEAAVRDLQRLSEDTDAIIKGYKRALEAHASMSSGLQREVEQLQEQAALADQVKPETADRYLRLLSRKVHSHHDGRFNEEMSTCANIGESVHSADEGLSEEGTIILALEGLSSDLADLLRTGGGISEHVRAKTEERDRRIKSKLGIMTSGPAIAERVDNKMHVAQPQSAHSSSLMTRDGHVGDQQLPHEVEITEVQQRPSHSRNTFSFTLGSAARRRSRAASAESEYRGPSWRRQSGVASSNDTLISPPGAYPAERHSLPANPSMLAPPQLAIAQADGTYGRSASSEVSRTSNEPLGTPVKRERRLSLSKALGKLFPALGAGASTSDLPNGAAFDLKSASDSDSSTDGADSSVDEQEVWPSVFSRDDLLDKSLDEDDCFFSATLGGFVAIPATCDIDFRDESNAYGLRLRPPYLKVVGLLLLVLLARSPALLLFLALAGSILWYSLIALEEVHARTEDS